MVARRAPVTSRGVSAETSADILDVDLHAFERGGPQARRAVVDGTVRSLRTGFVYTSHDLPASLLDEAYGMLAEFFSRPADAKASYVVPGSHGQTGYTGLLVETAASSDVADWKEMLNWALAVPPGHPLGRRYPHRYMDQVLPEASVPGITRVLDEFHRQVFDLQRRFLRIVAVGIGAHDDLFETMLRNGPTLTRAIHYPAMDLAPGASHVWAAEHGDINLITALPRASARGLQVRTETGWVDAVAPDDGVIVNSGMMLEQLTNGTIPTGIHRVVATEGQPGERYSVVQFCHPTPWTILAPLACCIDAERPQRHGAIEAGDRLDEVLWEINLVEDGRRLA
ncbi:MAG: isopenicillin N synthase family oxygenase [Acidimicrobiia bacterium]|nr:isopenicillin N synthase family oxygenase [Acidimicrobiia bacterium]